MSASKWIHFTLADSSYHVDGYTLYKVIAYKQESHGPVSQFEIWHRYSRIIQLYKQVKEVCINTGLISELPPLKKPSAFGRFSQKEIISRQNSIEVFFEFLARVTSPKLTVLLEEFFKNSVKVTNRYLEGWSIYDEFENQESASSSLTGGSHRKTITQEVEEHQAEGAATSQAFHDSEEQENNPESPKIVISPANPPAWETNFTGSGDTLRKGSPPSNGHNSGASSVYELENDVVLDEEEDFFKAWMSRATEDYTSSTGHRAGHRRSLSLDVKSESSSVSGGAVSSITSSIETTDPSQAPNSYFLMTQQILAKDWLQAALAENNKADLMVSSAAVTKKKKVLNGLPDYLSIAAQYISIAKQFENEENYENAFHSYKACIETLLRGVSGENDAFKREAIREKITAYITEASQLFLNNISSEGNLNIWDSTLSYYEESSVKALKKPIERLHKLKVLQTVKENIVVQDEFGKKHVLKVIKKPLSKSLDLKKYPGSIPYVVNIEMYFETEDSIIFCLQHIPGGPLWKQLKRYNRTPTSEEIPYHFQEESEFDFSSSLNASRKLSLKSRSGTFQAPTSRVEAASMTSSESGQSEDEIVSSSEADIEKSSESNESEESREPEKFVSIYDLWDSEPGLSKKAQSCSEKASSDADELTQESFDSTIKNSDSFKSRLKTAGKIPSFDQTCTASEFSQGKHMNEESLERIDKFLISFLSYDYPKSLRVEIHENVIRSWLAQILIAFDHMNRIGLYWGDFSPENILIDQGGKVILTHCFSWLEVSSESSWKKLKTWDNRCRYFIAPELLHDCLKVPNSVSDLWSLGAVVYSLINGSRFVHDSPTYSTDNLTFPDHISPNLCSLILSMLNFDPSDRISLFSTFSHPFFDSIDWKNFQK